MRLAVAELSPTGILGGRHRLTAPRRRPRGEIAEGHLRTVREIAGSVSRQAGGQVPFSRYYGRQRPTVSHCLCVHVLFELRQPCVRAD
jgi:hypothetical protein